MGWSPAWGTLSSIFSVSQPIRAEYDDEKCHPAIIFLWTCGNHREHSEYLQPSFWILPRRNRRLWTIASLLPRTMLERESINNFRIVRWKVSLITDLAAPVSRTARVGTPLRHKDTTYLSEGEWFRLAVERKSANLPLHVVAPRFPKSDGNCRTKKII